MKSYDLAVIGGGINGVGIAADAAGRGLRVALFEQADLGAATSTATSKLVHGGLRYLETGEYGLVRKALKESQLLLELAPHLIEPIDIHLPYQKHLRPWWMIRAGLFLYNHLASRPSYPSARAPIFLSGIVAPGCRRQAMAGRWASKSWNPRPTYNFRPG